MTPASITAAPVAAPPATSHPGPRRAFTLLELLVALGLIFLLASLVIVALGGVRAAANRADTISALRQMTQGYTAYLADNKQRLMPGNIDEMMMQTLGLQAKLPSGEPLRDDDAGSYVWRLAPYVDHNWEIMFTDYRSSELIARLNLEYAGNTRNPCGGGPPVFGGGSATQAGCEDIGISRSPAFGMNSVFVGGDNVHGGDDVTDRNPWENPNNPLAATRFSEVKNAARLILFAPTRFGEIPGGFPNPPPVSQIEFGSPEARPPFLDWEENAQNELVPVMDTEQWEVGANNQVVLQGEFTAGGGVPVSRWGKNDIPVAHLDGSVQTRGLLDLGSDLRLWSPFVTGF